MIFKIMDDVTIETTDEVLIHVLTVIGEVKQVIEAYKTLSYDEVLKATHYDWHRIADLMDACAYNSAYEPYEELVSNYYWEEHRISDWAYRNHVRADFEAFEREHIQGDVFIGTQDDFNFYSDWYKDYYGYRPRHIRKLVASI